MNFMGLKYLKKPRLLSIIWIHIIFFGWKFIQNLRKKNLSHNLSADILANLKPLAAGPNGQRNGLFLKRPTVRMKPEWKDSREEVTLKSFVFEKINKVENIWQNVCCAEVHNLLKICSPKGM
jgi:hypothetical protein